MTEVFQNTANSEYQIAATQLKSAKNTTSALKKSYVRYDHLIASAIDASTPKPACTSGCAFCCHYKVEVRAAEMLLIKEYMSLHFSEEKIEAILLEATANAAIIRTLTPEQHLTTNIKCALLQDNRCSIYPVRPFRCRNFHSTDTSACEKSHGDPGNMALATGLIADVALLADAHTQGFEAAAEQTKRDARIYDFTTALIEVFAEPSALKRYQRGKKAFHAALEII